MPFPFTPKTYVNLDVPDETDFNEQFRDNLNGLYEPNLNIYDSDLALHTTASTSFAGAATPIRTTITKVLDGSYLVFRFMGTFIASGGVNESLYVRIYNVTDAVELNADDGYLRRFLVYVADYGQYGIAFKYKLSGLVAGTYSFDIQMKTLTGNNISLLRDTTGSSAGQNIPCHFSVIERFNTVYS